MYVVGGPQGDKYRLASQGPNGWVNCNLRTTFLKVIRKAGLTPWPRLFHNLRASCETDLLAELPIASVTAWIGHSVEVALKHYAQVRTGDFDRAAGRQAVQNAGSYRRKWCDSRCSLRRTRADWRRRTLRKREETRR